jgi:hypothetical protein
MAVVIITGIEARGEKSRDCFQPLVQIWLFCLEQIQYAISKGCLSVISAMTGQVLLPNSGKIFQQSICPL